MGYRPHADRDPGYRGQIYAEAFRKVTGHVLKKMPELAGRTEPVIFREALNTNGISNIEGLYERFAAEQARGYTAHLDDLRRQGRALPGAADALRALSERADITQTVLTGNTRPSAELKLHAFGLDRYLDFNIGAYGTDDDTRAKLVAIARLRAQNARGCRFDNTDTVLIGDTPNDVAAARGAGARIIAVATGSNTVAELSEAGASTVLENLADTHAVLNAICGAST